MAPYNPSTNLSFQEDRQKIASFVHSMQFFFEKDASSFFSSGTVQHKDNLLFWSQSRTKSSNVRAPYYG